MKISIVIPLYNKAAHIGPTLAALLAQSRPADEVIVVDDASSDGSAALAEAILAADAAPRRELIRLPRNAGPGAARNRGLAAATGDFVLPLDADDRLEPRCLERVAAALAAHPGACHLILTYRRSGDGALRPPPGGLGPLARPLGGGVALLPRPVAALASDALGIIGSNLVSRRERALALGYDPRQPYLEGVDFWYRAFRAAAPGEVLLLEEPLVHYLELPDGLLNRPAAHPGEVPTPVLFERLAATRDPDERRLRRRIARAWLANAWQRLGSWRRRAAFLLRRPGVARAVWWGWLG